MKHRKRPGTTRSLVLAAHPREALAIAAGVALAAALSGRATREVGLVLVTVLVGRVTAGWLNDVADRQRDAAVHRPNKPVAQGWLDPSTVTFSVACATLLVIPLSVANGTVAGVAHLLAVAFSWLYDTRLKTTPYSWVPWAASFALYPTFLSYGGWGGGSHGGPATLATTLLAGLLGVGVHVLLSLRDLVGDHRNGLRSFPLVLALRTGAPRLLWLTVGYLAAVTAGLVVAGFTVGLTR